MAIIFLGLGFILWLTSLVCWIIVLTKVFPESVGKGVVALICPLYAFIWGWQNRNDGLQKIMPLWTAVIIASFALGGIQRAMLGS